ncbi:scavenger receptor class F member 1-like [Saccostrea cucullata]|uniref:scavenger receptor class F member 1-like n=1 Tax=Saccostrea cuccullata TaxID=36930 RepID=UPI002ED142B7
MPQYSSICSVSLVCSMLKKIICYVWITWLFSNGESIFSRTLDTKKSTGDFEVFKIGYIDENQRTKCPFPFFGVNCISQCSFEKENCHHVHVCSANTEDCPHGYFGTSCEQPCRYPNYGKDC